MTANSGSLEGRAVPEVMHGSREEVPAGSWPHGARAALALLLLALAGCRSVGRTAPAVADATPARAAVRRTLIARHPAHEAGWETRLYLVEYPPGASAAPHVHPAVGIGWVIDGA